ALFTGLFVIGDALDVLGEAFLLAHLLKPPEHLFGGLVAARLHLDHERDPFAQTALMYKRRSAQAPLPDRPERFSLARFAGCSRRANCPQRRGGRRERISVNAERA